MGLESTQKKENIRKKNSKTKIWLDLSRKSNFSRKIWMAKNQKNIAQRGARTHDPEIKSLMLYRLS